MTRRSRLLLAIAIIAGLTALLGVVGAMLRGILGATIGGAAGAIVGLIGQLVISRIEETSRDDRLAQRQKVREHKRIDDEFDEMSEPPPERLTAGRASVTALLRPESGVVPFTGREDDLRELTEWARQPAAGPVLLITGGAGVGKTRLALQLADLLGESWLTARVRSGFEDVAIARTVAKLGRGRQERGLLVVDYAETRDGTKMVALLEQLVDQRHRVRVLLLARDIGDWWERLLAARAAGQTVAVHPPIPLGTRVMGEQDDALVVAQAAEKFAEALGEPKPESLPAPNFVDGQSTILTLHAAALVAVRAQGRRLSRAVGDVYDAVLRHEERYWRDTSDRQLGTNIGMRVLRQAVALACLIPAASNQESADRHAARMIEYIPDLSDAPALTRHAVANWLKGLYPASSASGLGSLQPDLFAERHVCTQLSDPEFLRWVLPALSGEAAVHAFTVLTRASHHDPAARKILGDILMSDLPRLSIPAIDAARQTPGDLEALLTEALKGLDDISVLQEVLSHIPERTVALGQTAAIVAQRIADLSRLAGRPQPAVAWAEGVAGRRWLDIGNRDQARSCLESAETRYRALDTRGQPEPESYASVLGNLGSTWLGRDRERAIDYLRRAVRVLESRPDTADRIYAASLRELGMALADADQHTEAAERLRQARDTFATLARDADATNAEHLVAEVADCECRIGVLVRDRTLLERSVTEYRNLALRDPNTYLPDLGQACGDLGELLLATDRPTAIRYLREAVEHYRAMAQRDRTRFEPGLARSLTVLAEAEVMNDSSNAVERGAEAVTLLERLAATDPQRFEPRLATALCALRDGYWSKDQDAGRALSPARRAVRLYLNLSERATSNVSDERHTYALALAMAQQRLGELLLAAEIDEARVHVDAALAAYRRVPGVAGSDWARCLIDRSLLSMRAGLVSDAVTTMREAVTIMNALESAPDIEELRSRARSVRRANMAALDEQWKATVGTDVPEWLVSGVPE